MAEQADLATNTGGHAAGDPPPRPALSRRSDNRRLLAVLAAAWIAVLVFLLLVWPTPYRYEGESKRIRVNRVTGNAQVYDRKREEWRPARRGGRNARGTGSGESPVGGGRSGGSGRGEAWWYDEGEGGGGGRRGGDGGGDRWWAPEGGRSEERRREGSGSSSPIGGGGFGGGSPVGGGSRGGGSPVGGGDDGGGSPIGGSRGRQESRREEPEAVPGPAKRVERADRGAEKPEEEDPFWRE